MTTKPKPRRKSLAQVLYESWDHVLCKRNDFPGDPWDNHSPGVHKFWQAVARRARKGLGE